MEHQRLLGLLKKEVQPATGCTEPVAVAFAVAKACRLLEGAIKNITVYVSANIIKNAMGVTIPNTGEAGLPLAAALGMVLKNPEKSLELLDCVSSKDIAAAQQEVAAGHICICQADREGFYIEARAEGENGYAAVYVKDSHTNVYKTEKNGSIVVFADKEARVSQETPETEENGDSVTDLSDCSIAEFVEAVESIALEDIAFLQEGIDMNLRISEKGLQTKQGLGVGTGLQEMMEKGLISADLVNKARVAVAGAVDARMAGVGMPVMTTMGSGNHGIEATVPLAVVARESGASREKVLRALALSHLITAYVKQHTGRLTPICGCSIAAGVGAAAAITWLLGGCLAEIENAIKNLLANLTGMICDGAKGGCALKLSTSAGEAVLAALLALQGIAVSPQDGIISDTAEDTINNLGLFCREGMSAADSTILGIMLNKKNPAVLAG